MADNSTLPANGDVIAADDINGVKYQRMKVNFGADGVAIDVSSSSPLPIAAAPAINNFGQALAVTTGATATLANIASSTAGYQIKGFIAHGTGDGYFSLQVASVTLLSGRTRSTLPTLVISLANGVNVPTGSVVTLKVTNESGSTADYEATLLGA